MNPLKLISIIAGPVVSGGIQALSARRQANLMQEDLQKMLFEIAYA